MKSIAQTFSYLLPQTTAFAHCDIPCGIYDPYPMQIAAHTVVRMTQLILEAHAESDSKEDQKKLMHAISRYTQVKEEHAETIKREIRVIWGDYFKEEHVQKYQDLHTRVWKILKLASKARQTVDMDSAKKLLDDVLVFAEMFWETKNRKTVRVKSPYPTEGELVVLQ